MKKDVGLVGMTLALLAAVIWTANCIVCCTRVRPRR